jgi:[ribosomal protein S5]-alanine N-acetyltransferase
MNTEKYFQEFPVLETKRLILRPIKTDDAKELLKYYSDDDVTQFMSFHSIEGEEEAKRLIENSQQKYQKKEMIPWAITFKGEERLIGTCFLSDFSMDSIATIGYDLSKRYWNVGIMTESLKALVTFGFYQMGLHRIQSFLHPENIASIELLEKLNFKNEGYLREYQYHYDEKQFKNVFIFSLIKKDFECESICPA